jgi:arylsulfatase
MSNEISRRQFLQGAAALSAALGGFEANAAGRSRRGKDRLNILLVMCDQERAWKTLPANLALPSRQALAARGVSFTNYQVNAIACGPARGVIYTGQHVMRTGMYDNGGPPGRPAIDPARTPTLGKLLKSQGYHTAYKGKWHMSYVNRPEISDHTRELSAFGFDEWQVEGDDFGRAGRGASHDALVAGDAIRWLQTKSEKIAKERPWFLAVNLINPHDIMFFDATGRQNESTLGNAADRTAGSSMVGAPKRAPYDQDLGYDLPASFPDSLGSKPRAHAAYNELCDFEYGTIPISDVDSWRRYQNYYFNCLRDVDSEIGRIVAALDKSGQASRTIIIFTADHGEMGAAHGMRAKGPLLYPENADVPLVVVHPDVAGGKTCDGVVGSLDLAPTLLSMAGVSAETLASDYPFLKGYDVSPLVAAPHERSKRDEAGNLLVFSAALGTNPQAAWKRSSGKSGTPTFPNDFLDMDNRNFLRGFYDGRYRFGRYFSPSNHHTPRDWETLLANNDLELYDQSNDPHCLDNLANQPALHKELLLKLNAKLNTLIEREAGVDDGSHMPGDPGNWHRA